MKKNKDLLFKNTDFTIVNDWQDSLIWCPSQCELHITYKNNAFILYLRWRHDDPWTADLIADEGVDEKWITLDISYWKDTELEQCKKQAIVMAKLYIYKHY